MLTVSKQRIVYVVGDLLSTAFAWFIFNIIRYVDIDRITGNLPSLNDFLLYPQVILGQILFPLLMLGLYWLSGFYNKPFLKSRIEEFVTTLATAAFGAVMIFFIAIVNDPIPDSLSNFVLLLMLVGILFIVVYFVRVIQTTKVNRKILSGELRFKAIVVGMRGKGLPLISRLRKPVNVASYAFDIVGFSDINGADDAKECEVATVRLDDVERFCIDNDVKTVILATKSRNSRQTFELLNRFLPLQLKVLHALSRQEYVLAKPRLNRVAAEPLIDLTSPNVQEYTKNIKRAFDVIFSALALVLCLPVMLVLACVVKIDSRGPVIYSQERLGLHGRPFRIYKFRTMVENAEPNGPALASPNDNRVTPIGRFMRKYRLDELPQFYNVLTGTMSLVGPRPERAFYVERILKKAPFYTLVHQLRPGLTSLGMVRYGYADSVDGMIERMHYDLIYLENISITTDLKILVYTVATVVSGKGL